METVFSFLRVRQRTEETVFSFRRFTNGNGFQFPASLAENEGNGFQIPSLYRRKWFSVSCEFGREWRKQFPVSAVLHMETAFSFPRFTDGYGFQFPASLAENGGNDFQFPSFYQRQLFSVSCEFGRGRRKRFSFSVVVQTETVFSFLRVWQRTEETVSSFRRSAYGNGFQFPAFFSERKEYEKRFGREKF
jgi:hypothetical protein